MNVRLFLALWRELQDLTPEARQALILVIATRIRDAKRAAAR